MKIINAVVLLLIFCTCNTYAQINPTGAAERLKGIERRKALEEHSLVNNIPFKNIGPSIMSGRVTDINVNPNDPTNFYVAYASGGLWYTHNNGQSFEPLFDHEDVISIGAIAVDYKNNTIYVGTGEANSSRSSYSGIGIYKTADNGKNWKYCGLPESQHISKILIDPNNANIIYVAVIGHLYSPSKDRGIYKTTDGGNTWKQILFIDENTGGIDLKMDPSNTSILYACMWHRERTAWNFTGAGQTSGIYKTTDAGKKWTLITDKNSGFPTGDGNGRIGVSIYDNNPSILYAVIDNQERKPNKSKNDTSLITSADLKNITKANFLLLNNEKLNAFLRNNGFPEIYNAAQIKDSVLAGNYKPTVLTDYLNDANNSLFDTPVKGCEIYKSTDAGITWKKTCEKYLDGVYFTYGYYFGTIYISPINENKIILLGYPILMSEDGGKTFRDIDGDNTHPDFHMAWINPKNDKHIIVGNDGGVNITYDDGSVWYKANNPPVAQLYSVNADNATPYNVYCGLQDNGVWFGPSTYSAGTAWTAEGNYPYKDIYGGDGMQVQIDTRDNTTVYAGYQFGYYARLNTQNTNDYADIHPSGNLGEPSLRFNWQTPICLSKFNQDILYYGSDKFHRSLNKGDNLETLSGDITNGGRLGNVPYGTITTIAESPIKFGLLYCGTDDGNIQMSQDGGYSWTKISSKLPQGLWVSRVTPSAFSEKRIYASLNGYRFDNFNPYLFVTNDGGNTWTQLGNDLPFEPINVIKEDVKNENIIYVGTDNGLYISLNKGKSFMSFSKNFPRVAVHDIVIQKRENDLIIGTHGRSIYIANLNEIQLLNDTLISKNIYAFDIPKTKYNKALGHIDASYTPPVQASVSLPYYVKQKEIITATIKNKDDISIKILTDTVDAGINYFQYDFTIDTSAISKINESLIKDESKYEMSKADDGNYYATPGIYTVIFSTSQTNSSSTSFEIVDVHSGDSGGQIPLPSEELFEHEIK